MQTQEAIQSMAQSLRTLESDPLKNTLNEFNKAALDLQLILFQMKAVWRLTYNRLFRIFLAPKKYLMRHPKMRTINSVLKQFATKYKPSEVYKKHISIILI